MHVLTQTFIVQYIVLLRPRKYLAIHHQKVHWSKNFAALSVHRREEWVVIVKGFNRFVWGFEGTYSENPHGIFASHGSMLIANSEEGLRAHDVDNGWD